MFDLFTDRTDVNATDAAPASRCDNYESYLIDELGYAWDARDIVSLAKLERHEALLAASADELRALDAEDDTPDDFLRWARARRWRQLGELERFAAELEAILDSDQASEALNYHEIHLFAAHALADARMYDRAMAFLDRYADQWPEERAPSAQLRAVILLERDDLQEAQRVLDGLADEYARNAEILYEVAETLAVAEYGERSAEWLERAREAARKNGNRPLLVDIDLLESRLSEPGLETRGNADDDPNRPG